MKFGQKVQELRKNKKLSQEKLAEVLGTSAAMVSKYERSEINPSVEVARKLAKTFSVTLDYLVDQSNTEPIFKDKKMVDRFFHIQKMHEVEKEQILSVIDAFIRDYQVRKAYSSK